MIYYIPFDQIYTSDPEFFGLIDSVKPTVCFHMVFICLNSVHQWHNVPDYRVRPQ